MRLNKDKAQYSLLALVIGCLYTILSINYNNTLLLHDGAFVFMQMLEIWKGNLFDPLHINYSYCGVLAHAIISFLGLFLPLGWAMMFGGGLTLLVGFYFLQQLVSSEKKILCLLILALPMPAPFGWLFSAGGEYLAAICFVCIAGYLLTKPRFQTPAGLYNKDCFWFLGLASGFAVYSYLPNAILVLAAIMSAGGLNLLQLLLHRTDRRYAVEAGRKQYKNLLFFAGAFVIGYLPHILGLAFFGRHHRSSPPGFGIRFDLEQISMRFVYLYETLGTLFSPVTRLGLEKLDLQRYINLVAADFILPKSPLGPWLAMGLCSLFLFYILRSICEKTREKGLPLFLLLGCLGTIAAYTLVPPNNFSKYDTRLFVGYYFMICIGIVFCSGKVVARIVSLGLSALLIFSCVNVLIAHQNFDAQKAKETTCTSLTSAQIFSVLERINPEAIAGSYRDVTPVAAVLKKTIVLDLSENKFRHTNKQFQDAYALILASKDRDPEKIFRSPLSWMLINRGETAKTYMLAELSHYQIYFEVMPQHTWDDFLKERGLAPHASWETLINDLLKPFAKEHCVFEEIKPQVTL